MPDRLLAEEMMLEAFREEVRIKIAPHFWDDLPIHNVYWAAGRDMTRNSDG